MGMPFGQVLRCFSALMCTLVSVRTDMEMCRISDLLVSGYNPRPAEFSVFIHFKPELLLQFPASNDKKKCIEKKLYLLEIDKFNDLNSYFNRTYQ